MLTSSGTSNLELLIVANPSKVVSSKNFTLTNASVSLVRPLNAISLPFKDSSQVIAIFVTKYLPWASGNFLCSSLQSVKLTSAGS